MRGKLTLILYTAILLIALSSESIMAKAKKSDFIVVIDAGHGGHDPGAIGKISNEKTINLNIALELGRRIEKNCPDVKVIYTRKTDRFIPLQKRAAIANEAKANLFISIHTNSLPKGKIAYGASTWTLGLARSQANLDVAKRENAVILYEDDYKTRYAGFDPNSAESYIIFEFLQDKYMSESVRLASLVQKEFEGYARRKNKGVRQAGFLVLKASAMPSILVEVGFISTPKEETYLNSTRGISNMAESIFRAFQAYRMSLTKAIEEPSSIKPEVTEKIKVVNKQEAKNKTSKEMEEKPVFKIQVLVSRKPLKTNDKQFKGLKNIDCFKENGWYKYTYKESTDYNKIQEDKHKINNKFKDSFIIAFMNGEKIDINKAISIFKKTR